MSHNFSTEFKFFYINILEINKRIMSSFSTPCRKFLIRIAVNVGYGTLSTPLMVVTKPRLSLVSSVSLYQLTYLYRTYFWAFSWNLWVKCLIISNKLDNKKTNFRSLATENLRNYSGEKFFLWILRFVGVWNICKIQETLETGFVYICFHKNM